MLHLKNLSKVSPRSRTLSRSIVFQHETLRTLAQHTVNKALQAHWIPAVLPNFECDWLKLPWTYFSTVYDSILWWLYKCINNQVHTHVYLILRSNFFSRRHTTGISKDSLRYLSTTFQASFSSEYALILIHSRCGFNLPNRKSQMYQSVSQTN